MTWSLVVRGLFRRRTYRLLANMVRADPRLWHRNVRSSIAVAREALDRGALQKRDELAPLIALVGRRGARGALEIGTNHGGTLYAWCRVAAPDATILSVDLPGGPFGGGYSDEEAERFRTYAQPGQTLHLLRADSHADATRADVAALLQGRPLDFLMIDGDHTYDGVRRDFDLYAPLVRPGGLIAFHDVIADPTLPPDKVGEVHAFWRELRRSYRHREFLAPRDDRGWGGRWGGIGVLFWPGREEPAAPASR